MITAYILIQTQVGRPADVAYEASKIPGVKESESVTGPYDVIARGEAETLDELAKIVMKKIQEIDGVTRTLTCPVVRL